MFGITVVTPPTTEPLELDEVKSNLRFPYAHEDQLIQSLITAARLHIETATGRALITQTLRLTRDCFPRYGGEIRLPRPPLLSLTADEDNPDLGIAYTDAAGAEQDVDPASYVVDTSSLPGRIALAYGESWPTDAIEQIAAVKVTYLAGYGAATAVPKTIKQAMQLLVAHWFVNREAVGSVGSEIGLAVKALLVSEWTGQLTADFG